MSATTSLVEPAVVEYLSHAPLERRVAYSAGCAERWVQVFTGLRDRHGSREHDIEYVVKLMDRLWSGNIRQTDPGAPHALARFPELQSRERPLTAVGDIYCFYAILIARYAAAAALGDSAAAISCGHGALTAVGQLDQNVQERDRQSAGEFEFQREVMFSDAVDSLASYRVRCQEISQQRLRVVEGRIR